MHGKISLNPWCISRGWILLGVILLIATGTAFSQQPVAPAPTTNNRVQQIAPPSATSAADVPIGSGDLLHIDVFDVPELSRDVRVSETGYISIPLLPTKVLATGLSTFQLEEKLAELLQSNGLVSSPVVSIFVREQNSQPITVIGAVSRPIVYQAVRQSSLLEAISQAGGISPDAGNIAIITRGVHGVSTDPNGSGQASVPMEPQTININLRELLDTGDSALNIPLFGGDTVTIPRGGIFYVAGAVNQPGGFVLQSDDTRITTMKALALAHGSLSTAKMDNAVILRRDPKTGDTQPIPIHLKKVMARKEEDVVLQPNDVLFVPDSTGKHVLAKSLEAAFAIATGTVLIKAAR